MPLYPDAYCHSLARTVTHTLALLLWLWLSSHLLLCGAVWCCVKLCGSVWCCVVHLMQCGAASLQCVAVCCSVLQFVTLWLSVSLSVRVYMSFVCAHVYGVRGFVGEGGHYSIVFASYGESGDQRDGGGGSSSECCG